MGAIEFQINLSGNLTTALNKGGKALHETGEHAKKAKHEFELFEAETGKLSGSLGGLEFNLSALGKGGSLFTFDLAEAFKSAYELAEKLVDKVIDLGKEMVGVAGKTQDLNLAIKLNVGDERAKEIDELAESFERTTRFSPSDIKRALLPLLKQGIADKDTLDSVATIATDLAARNAGGISDVQETISSFAGIFQRGRLKPAQLAQFGIQANDYFKELGASLGVTSDAAAKMAKQGKISQDKLADIAINLIARRQGGSIGQPSLDSNKTLGATLERLSHLQENIFERVAKSPGMAAVQGFLDNFIATLNGPMGTELAQKFSDAFTTVFGDLSGPNGMQKLQAALKGLADDFKGFIADFQAAWPDIKAAASGLWEIFKGIAKTIEFIVGGWAKLADFVHDWDRGQIQKDIVDFVKGEHGGIANDTVNENSPAWKKAKAAGLPVGGAGGIDVVGIPHLAAGGLVKQPTLGLIGESGPEAVVPLGDPSMSSTLPIGGAASRGRGDITVSLGDININVIGADKSGQEIGLEAAQTVRIEVKKLLDEIGWTYGATVVE